MEGTMKSIITPSDVMHLIVISNLISRGRETHSSDVEHSQCPFAILCLLGDVLDPPKSVQYCSLRDFEQNTLNSVNTDKDCALFVKDCVMYMNGIESIDDLMDFFDTLRGVFWDEDTEKSDMNKLSSPSCIRSDSFLGTYVRACSARWECMDFNGICIAFEELLAFKHHEDQEQDTEQQQHDPLYLSMNVKRGMMAADADTYSAFTCNDTSKARRDLTHGLGRSPSHLEVFGATPGDGYGDHHDQHHDSADYLLNAQKALLRDDYATAEHALHSYFDSGTRDPLSLNSTALGLGMGGAVLCAADVELAPERAFYVALDSLVMGTSSGNTQNKSRSRHQKSMVALVSMWAAGGHAALALQGIDEGMKISHQRGDHSAVTEALLLLHMIKSGPEFGVKVKTAFRGSNGSDSGSGSEKGGVNANTTASSSGNSNNNRLGFEPLQSEEVLQRCLRRCAQYNLKALAVQASVLLASLRAQALPARAEALVRLSHSAHDTHRSSALEAAAAAAASAGGDSSSSDEASMQQFCGLGVRAVSTCAQWQWKLIASAVYVSCYTIYCSPFLPSFLLLL
jgi:hypothetical protein